MSAVILTNACRCCMMENENLQNIYEKFQDNDSKTDPNMTYSEAINLCTNIQIDLPEDDSAEELSHWICENCLYELRVAVNFRTKCEETDAVLRGHLEQNDLSGAKKTSLRLMVEKVECVEEEGEVEESNYDDSASSYLDDRTEQVHGSGVVVLKTTQSVEENNKDIVYSYKIENIPVFSEEDLITEGHEEIVYNTEVEVVDTLKSVDIKRIKMNPKKRNWFECDQCRKGFNLEKLLQKHIEYAHSGKPLHLCNICGEFCLNELSLKAHLLQHQDKKFSCEECDKTYISKKGLQWHLLQHQDIKPEKKYLCSTCGMKFRTGQRLKIHTLTHTGEKNHACEYCSKSFATESRLRSHRRTHTGERPYECSECGLTFAQTNALKCHKRIHTGEKPYKCKFCDKCFSQHTILKTHMTLHTGKTVKCPDCDKKFSRASYLILHRREHTGEKPYACEQCSNRYKQKSHLDRHMDTHLGIKHKCTICSKEYSKQWTLKMHMFSHSDKKPFQCDKCPLSFIRNDKYKMHLKVKHSPET